jgi:redox-sensitive bicupin YhaK (pirin superfamily)
MQFIPLSKQGRCAYMTCNKKQASGVLPGPCLVVDLKMIELRPFSSLGGANHGWLDAKHHFSFAEYHDPARMNWGNLRVWNDDQIAPNTGFPPHPHNDMEIITYVREGAITHEDSLGNKGRTEAGDVQVMSAGTGIRHSEYNREEVTTCIFQIWIVPTRRGEAPSWDARPFPKGDRAGKFVTLASGYGEDDALPIRTDARVLGATLKAGTSAEYPLSRARKAYLVPATGKVQIENVTVNARDGAAIRDIDVLRITAVEDSEIIMVDAG